MKNHYVIVLYPGGKYRIWPDYGDIAWGSPAYAVIGYADSYREAQAFVRKHKTGA